MIQKLICRLPNPLKTYSIEIGERILDSQIDYLRSLGSKFAIITDDNIAPIYGEQLHKTLLDGGINSHLFIFPNGEKNKIGSTKENLENQLFQNGFHRDSCILALGGGVVTDLAGYIAATFCRGIPLIMIPTSLMGMVDASLGGKTGINVSFGKNLLGCIYQPKKVVMDLKFLKTLPQEQFRYGSMEIIKHALISSLSLFEYLEKTCFKLLNLDIQILQKVIFESCSIKLQIVENDETEQGNRRLLNFGHTIGHALEKLTKYSMPHGQAVAIGLLGESYLSYLYGALSLQSLTRIKHLVEQFNINLKLPERFSISSWLEAMRNDKKSVRGQSRFVLIQDIGSPLSFDSQFCTTLDESLITQALQWINDDMCGD